MLNRVARRFAALPANHLAIDFQSDLLNFYGGIFMLNWVLLFLIVAIVAAVLGFTGIAVQAAGIAKIIFIIFLILFVISLVMHLFRR